MKFTILIENTTENELVCEHGLSICIEHAGQQILLDAGSSDLFLENAKALHIPVEKADICVLSHGHYDHAGGFLFYLEKNEKSPVYVMKTAGEEYYSAAGGMHEIGIPKAVLQKYYSRFTFVDGNVQIGKDTYLIPHSTKGLDRIGKRTGLYRKADGAFVPDDFSHEQSLVCKTKEGLFVFNSCSHGGVRAILEEVKKAFPAEQIVAFVGGLHMKDGMFSEEEIKELADYIRASGLQNLYTGHCTGEGVYAVLKECLGDVVQKLTTGKTVDFSKNV